MKLSSGLIEILTHLKTPAVRDLAWALGAPPILSIHNQPHLCSSQYFEQILSEHGQWLIELDKTPGRLFEHLEGVASYRLGAYFEGLIEFWIHQTKTWQLVAHDFQVYQDKQTIGAFDFIVKNQSRCEHWEVAVKYYLGVDGHADWHHWIGPNQRDRLDVKMNRMCDHQIQLSRKAAGAHCLKNLGVQTQPAQRIWIKGLFFRPWGTRSLGPHHSTGKPQSIWIDDTTIESYIGRCRAETYWIERHKPDWLCPIIGKQTERIDANQLRTILTTAHRPVMVSEVRSKEPWPTAENRRLFLVPRAWRSRAASIIHSINST